MNEFSDPDIRKEPPSEEWIVDLLSQGLNRKHLEASFEPEYAVDPDTGETYLSRGSDGIIYSGPNDPGMYDF